MSQYIFRELRRDICPCCGAPMTSPRLIVSLERNTLSYGRRQWRMVPQFAEFMYALNEAWPKMVDYLSLGQAIWGTAMDEPDHARRMLMVYASHGRKIVRTFGGEIECAHKRGFRLVLPSLSAPRLPSRQCADTGPASGSRRSIAA